MDSTSWSLVISIVGISVSAISGCVLTWMRAKQTSGENALKLRIEEVRSEIRNREQLFGAQQDPTLPREVREAVWNYQQDPTLPREVREAVWNYQHSVSHTLWLFCDFFGQLEIIRREIQFLDDVSDYAAAHSLLGAKSNLLRYRKRQEAAHVRSAQQDIVGAFSSEPGKRLSDLLDQALADYMTQQWRNCLATSARGVDLPASWYPDSKPSWPHPIQVAYVEELVRLLAEEIGARRRPAEGAPRPLNRAELARIIDKAKEEIAAKKLRELFGFGPGAQRALRMGEELKRRVHLPQAPREKGAPERGPDPPPPPLLDVLKLYKGEQRLLGELMVAPATAEEAQLRGVPLRGSRGNSPEAGLTTISYLDFVDLIGGPALAPGPVAGPRGPRPTPGPGPGVGARASSEAARAEFENAAWKLKDDILRMSTPDFGRYGARALVVQWHLARLLDILDPPSGDGGGKSFPVAFLRRRIFQEDVLAPAIAMPAPAPAPAPATLERSASQRRRSLPPQTVEENAQTSAAPDARDRFGPQVALAVAGQLRVSPAEAELLGLRALAETLAAPAAAPPAPPRPPRRRPRRRRQRPAGRGAGRFAALLDRLAPGGVPSAPA
eukprot:tig00000553_g2093.t1